MLGLPVLQQFGRCVPLLAKVVAQHSYLRDRSAYSNRGSLRSHLFAAATIVANFLLQIAFCFYSAIAFGSFWAETLFTMYVRYFRLAQKHEVPCTLASSGLACLSMNSDKLLTALLGRIEERLSAHDSQFDKLLEAIEASNEETKRHFDVVAEALRHDLIGIHSDKIANQSDRLSDHEKRLVKLERANPLFAA